MAARRPVRNKPVPPSAAWAYPAVLIAACSAGAGWAMWLGWPGLAVLQAGLAISGWITQPPTLTGELNAARQATAANQAEERGLRRYRFFTSLRWRVLFPGRDWLPAGSVNVPPAKKWAPLGKVTTVGVLALALAVAAGAFPVPRLPGYGWVLDAVAAYGVTMALCAALRRGASPMHVRPQVTFSALAAFTRELGGRAAGWATGAGVAGVIVAVAVLWFAPASWGACRWAIAGGLGVAAAIMAGSRPVTAWVRQEWRSLVDADEEWQQRWAVMKLPEGGRPFLYSWQVLGEGSATCATFAAPAQMGATWFASPKNLGQLANAIGGGTRLVVLPVPNVDAAGMPVPGTRHPLDVRIVTWANGLEPDLGSAQTDPGLVSLALECAMAEVCDDAKMPRPLLDQFELLGTMPVQSDDDKAALPGESGQLERACFRASFTYPDGGSPAGLCQMAGPAGQVMDCEAVMDRFDGWLYFGDLAAAPSSAARHIEDLQTEAHWGRIWRAALKMGVQPPLYQPATFRQARLADGSVISSVSFAVGGGQTLADFLGFEDRLMTADQQAVFMACTGMPDTTKGKQPGERHKLGVTIHYAENPGPGEDRPVIPASPARLAPGRIGQDPNLAQSWVLTGMVGRAFDAAKLARPQVIGVFPMTSSRSREHIWGIKLRLYGGVTTPDVRKRSQVLAQTWGVPWLRIGPAKDEIVTIFAGAMPSSVQLANPERDEFRVTALDWEQAWVDARVTNPATGATPVLLEAGRLPFNDKVQVLVFELPAGVSAAQAKAAAAKLRTSTGNLFIQPRPSPDSASKLIVLACREDPVPFPALTDFQFIDEADGHLLPFGVGVEGEPVSFNTKSSAHALIAGMTGGGKSVLVQSLIYGAIVRGWDVYIGDPSKGAADFQFAVPYAKAIATTLEETAAMATCVYEEVKRRKDLNSSHGAASIKDLPSDIRPARILFVLDEFTSLIMTDQLPPQSDDPEAQAERARVQASNALRAKIGGVAGRVAREARSAGVTMFLATQKLTSKTLDSVPGGNDLKSNLARALLGNSNQGERMSALRSPDDAPDLGQVIPPGRGLWEPSDGKPVIIQAWYTEGEQATLTAQLAARRAPLRAEEQADLAPYMPRAEQGPAIVDLDGEEDLGEAIDLGEISFTLDDLEDAPVTAGEGTPVGPGAANGEKNAELHVWAGTGSAPVGFVVLPPATEELGWAVADAIAAQVARHPGIATVVIGGASGDEENAFGVTYRELAEMAAPTAQVSFMTGTPVAAADRAPVESLAAPCLDPLATAGPGAGPVQSPPVLVPLTALAPPPVAGSEDDWDMGPRPRA